jgi:hypothetical protein
MTPVKEARMRFDRKRRPGERPVWKRPTRDEEAAPAAQVSFFFLFREAISPLRHNTTNRELSDLFIPLSFSSSLIRSALIKHYQCLLPLPISCLESHHPQERAYTTTTVNPSQVSLCLLPCASNSGRTRILAPPQTQKPFNKKYI